MSTNQPRPLTILDAFILLLVAFKLAHVGEPATWSWWVVLSPLWIYLVALVTVKVLLRVGQRTQKKKETKEALRRSFR